VLLNEMIDALRECCPVAGPTTAPGREISDVRLLDTTDAALNPSTLYFGSAGMLGTSRLPGAKAAMILASPCAGVSVPAGASVFSVPEEDLFRVFNAAKDLCLADLTIKADMAGFLFSSKHGYLTDMVNEAARLLANPVLVWDLSYRLLAYSDTVPGDDWLRAFVRDRGWNTDFIRHALQVDAALKVEGNRPFLVTTCADETARTLSAKLVVEGTTVGSLAMRACSTPISPGHYRQLALMAPLIAEAAGSLSNLKHIGTVQEKLMGDILEATGDVALSEAYLNIKDLFAAEVPRRMILLVVGNPRGPVHRDRVAYLRFSLKELFPSSFVAYHKDRLAMLLPVTEDQAALSRPQLATLSGLLTAERLMAGVSNCFSDLSLLPSAFEQGKSALAYCDEAAEVKPYHDCLFGELARAQAPQHDINEFTHPALRLIERYDSAHGTQLARTLQVYIEGDKSVERCTEALHLHRSSVYYRLRRIGEIGDLDIDDPQVAFQLQCSYRIQRANAHALHAGR
jgi:sugar diacid utilization regulator